ncbi:unnamed protein product [Calicophoron daubneyi]|uniref:RRM domain-containing protein n=1 Tax=Calicophoron daubneyi TaxID=300641 RepID=A0AAV2TW17_CALDB
MSRVYIGRLPPRCSERDIERFFKGYGRLRDVVLKNGYGFVEFDNEKDADDAVYDLHGRELRGERIIVEHARLPPGSRGGSRRGGNRDRRYGPPTRTEYRVVVENLSSRVSWQDLKDMMRKAGDVTYADAHKSSRNDGIVEFAAYADMKEAIEKFDGYELYGRRLRVYEDRPNRRSKSGSRSDRSRSNDSYRRNKSHSSTRGRRRGASGSSGERRSGSRERQNSAKRSHDSADARSRSASHRSASRHSDDRSASHHSDKRSAGAESRSPSRNGRESAKEESEHRSRSRSVSGSRSRSRSRSAESRSADRSRSRSRSGSRSRSRSASHHSRTPSEDRHSDQEMDNSKHSDYDQEDRSSSLKNGKIRLSSTQEGF